jgi:type I restriction enzyme, S subunit
MSELLLKHFDLLATAPVGVARLRDLILTLAVQGKLVPQDPADEPASELLKLIRAEKDRLIAAGKIKRDKSLAPIAEDEQPFELPLSWEWVRLGELVNLTYGKNLPTSSLTEDGFPVFGANGVIGRYREYLYEDEQLLISCRGAYSGKPNISPKKCFVTNNSIVCEFVARPMVDLSFFFRQLQISDKSRLVTGSAQPQVTIANADPLVLAVPPLSEQSRIVARVEELMRLCDALEAKRKLDAAQHAQLLHTLLGTLTDSTTPEELATHWQRVAAHFDLLLDRPEAVDALEQTILQLAVRGLLVPQDPNDEPASVLLQRIRAEKDRLIADGKIKRDKPLLPITDDEKPFKLPQGWEWVRLPEIYYSISPSGSKLLSSAVQLEGKHPVVDQGQRHIAGYTNDDSLLIKIPGPIIIFGDHTKEIKYIDFDFVAGADGTKILRPVNQNERYFALQLRSFSLEDRGYSRHFKVLNSCLFALPPHAEQSRIIARVEELRKLCIDLRQRLTASRTTQGQLAEALVEDLAA